MKKVKMQCHNCFFLFGFIKIVYKIVSIINDRLSGKHLYTMSHVTCHFAPLSFVAAVAVSGKLTIEYKPRFSYFWDLPQSCEGSCYIIFGLFFSWWSMSLQFNQQKILLSFISGYKPLVLVEGVMVKQCLSVVLLERDFNS